MAKKIPATRKPAPGMISWREARERLGVDIDIQTIDGDVLAREHGRRTGLLRGTVRGGHKLDECPVCGDRRNCLACDEKEITRLGVAQHRAVQGGKKFYKIRGYLSKPISETKIERISVLSKEETHDGQVAIWDGGSHVVLASYLDVVTYVGKHRDKGYPVLSVIRPMGIEEVRGMVKLMQDPGVFAGIRPEPTQNS